MEQQNDRLDYLREKSGNLPFLPGVYIMKDKSQTIIYVGKAKELRRRVGQYFRALHRHEGKVLSMVMNVYDFDFIVTDSEFEALVLECSLIKQHNPKYNILLKDDKGYSYACITNEPYPRLKAVYQKANDKNTYIGPYMSSFSVRQTVEEAVHSFQLPTCTRKFPAEFGKGRPCLNYHIKQCMGVCTGLISEEKYREIVNQAVDMIRKGSVHTLERLQEEMQAAAEQMDFETAAQLRDRIRAIENVNQRQKLVFSKVPEQDVIAFAQDEDVICAAILKFRDSRLVDKEDYLISQWDDLVSTRTEFLERYYSVKDEVPKQVTLDGEINNRENIKRYLDEKAGRSVSIVVPQMGEQMRLVLMATKNAVEVLSTRRSRNNKDVAALDEISKLLGLSHVPKYIEAYDISHTAGDNIVGAMVVFENGKPKKAAYKRFEIKTVAVQDDYASIREVVIRRFKRYFDEETTDPGFKTLPDLLLLDGGKGQVNAVLPALREMGIDVPVFGMVKDSKHKTRAISSDGGEIGIKANRGAFTFITKIQDEVHRFAISYHQQKRKKSMLEMSLLEVEGIGEAKAKDLFKAFKTVKAMKEATVEQLCEVKGITPKLAKGILDHFAG